MARIDRSLRIGVLASVILVLAACTGVDPTLGIAPVANVPATSTPAAALPDLASAPVVAAPAPAANAASGMVVAFAPITGIAAAQAGELTGGLAGAAPAEGLVLAAPGDPAARFLVKGYLSAVPETAETTVIYVFDVLDAAGNRLHRIQGSEKVPGASADGWGVVPGATMRRIAARTMDELAAWSDRRRG